MLRAAGTITGACVGTCGIVVGYIHASYPQFPIKDRLNRGPKQLDINHHVGSTRFRFQNEYCSGQSDSSTVALQVFYPCDTPNGNNSKTVRTSPENCIEDFKLYFRTAAVQGLGNSFPDYLPMWVFEFMIGNRLHHCLVNAQPKAPPDSALPYADPSNSPESANQALAKAWPVAIFSHGLFGNMDMYSSLCADLAVL